MAKTILRIMTKEMGSFFASMVGYLFLGCFAAVCLFIFFWGEAFFARNIIDVRPLFEWMPILLIFLSAALSMRMWSEERKSGTIEHVMTVPVPLWQFVVGKYLACMALLGLALLLTLPLVLSISLLGQLDWGPVWSGYLATLLLGSAYLSIGLFVSAKNDNQLVSLITTVLVCSVLYLVGSPMITGLLGNQGAAWLSALGSGSRFEAITRGVIDFRDLFYYLSLTGCFLVLNHLALQKSRWSSLTPTMRRWQWAQGLLVLNLLVANGWLFGVHSLRVDTTHGKLYSLSSTTQNYIEQLQEPLVIRAYVSAKTHPLLAPLLPQLKDLLAEYAFMGQGKIRFEWVDPAKEPELEEEANSKYGIKPVPFQVSDKYQASLVNSYFDVLIQYGNEYQVLGFKDLIEIKSTGETDIDVKLRNPEYDITRAIKKVLFGFASGGNLFEQVNQPLTFSGFVSADNKLPDSLVEFKAKVQERLNDYVTQSGGRLKVNFSDPDANGGRLAQQLLEEFGFRPMATSIADTQTFYFYMILTGKEHNVLIPIPESLDTNGFERSFDAAVKRFASGFMKTVSLWVPDNHPMMQQYGVGSGKQFTLLEGMLSENFKVRKVSLEDGKAPEDTDILMLVAPHSLGPKQLFAVDQFLMQGGAVVMATSPFAAEVSQTGLSLSNYHSGVGNWLSHHGITIDKQLVLDQQSVAFPLPVTREVGGAMFQELHMLDYPYFVDVRDKGLNHDNPVTSSLQQMTMPWVSPIAIEENGRQVYQLMQSSKNAWLSDDMDIMPKMGEMLVPEGDMAQYALAVAMQGQFQSYFNEAPDLVADSEESPEKSEPIVSSVINQSPNTAKLMVFASNEFLEDNLIQMGGIATGTDYLNPLQMMINAVEWSLEDKGLLDIRTRSHFSRTIDPLTHDQQMLVEYGNYVLALMGVVMIGFMHRYFRRRKVQRLSTWIKEVNV